MKKQQKEYRGINLIKVNSKNRIQIILEESAILFIICAILYAIIPDKGFIIILIIWAVLKYEPYEKRTPILESKETLNSRDSDHPTSESFKRIYYHASKMLPIFQIFGVIVTIAEKIISILANWGTG